MANEILKLHNMALGILGAPRIQTAGEDSPSQDLIDDFFDATRRGMLSSYPWKGGKTIEDLAENTAVSVPDRWKKAFDLPAKALTVWKVNDVSQGNEPQPLWEPFILPTESPPAQFVFMDFATAKAEFSYDLDTDALMALLDPIAYEALSHRLAIAMARAWGKKENDIKSLRAEYERIASEARSVSGMQGKPKDAFAAPLVDARIEGLVDFPYPRITA